VQNLSYQFVQAIIHRYGESKSRVSLSLEYVEILTSVGGGVERGLELGYSRHDFSTGAGSKGTALEAQASGKGGIDAGGEAMPDSTGAYRSAWSTILTGSHGSSCESMPCGRYILDEGSPIPLIEEKTSKAALVE
jgi:hypothetical protein